MEDEFECNDCGYSGMMEELVAETDDIEDWDFSCCPSCGSREIEEIEQDEFEEED